MNLQLWFLQHKGSLNGQSCLLCLPWRWWRRLFSRDASLKAAHLWLRRIFGLAAAHLLPLRLCGFAAAHLWLRRLIRCYA